MLTAGMSLQEWVKMRSQELQTKEKQKATEKRGTMETARDQETAELIKER